MNKIFAIIGKSSSGKDTIFKKLLKNNELLQLTQYVPYTTRPMRENEKEGVDYFFISNDQFNLLVKKNKMLEYREYNTANGLWKYGTVLDNQFNSEKNILMILTLEAYNSIKSSGIIPKENVIPIYIELDDGERLERALKRERIEKNPKYIELCRRFIADSEDFSEEKILSAGINKRFINENLDTCLDNIIIYIKENS